MSTLHHVEIFTLYDIVCASTVYVCLCVCTCSVHLGKSNNYRENGSLRSIGRGGADVVKHGVRGELERRGYHAPGIDGHRGKEERCNLIIRLWTGHTVYGIWPSASKKET